MQYRIHSKGDMNKVTIYTTSDDVVEQLNDKTRSTLEFLDARNMEVILPKENVIRILKIGE